MYKIQTQGTQMNSQWILNFNYLIHIGHRMSCKKKKVDFFKFHIETNLFLMTICYCPIIHLFLFLILYSICYIFMNIFKMLILKIKNKNIHNWHIKIYIVYYIREISKLSLINTHKTILIHDVWSP
jgi:hypothetical protein